MKKTIYTLVILVFTVGLVGFAFDRMMPASVAQAISEYQPAMEAVEAPEKEVGMVQHPVGLAVFVAIGLVCMVFGAAAVSPLIGEGEE